MKTLIPPSEVLLRAFRNRERLPVDTVTEADILTVESRYIRPVLGEGLYARLLVGSDNSFIESYLADAVALLTRYLLLPRLLSFCSPMGLFRPDPSNTSPLDATTLEGERKALKQEAMTLLRRATDYLEQHAEEFTEYDPKNNILNRCMTHGGFVQTF